jgi:hypothetical protein
LDERQGKTYRGVVFELIPFGTLLARFISLVMSWFWEIRGGRWFIRHWDTHGNMAMTAPLAKNVDQAITALITDLKNRGMLEETLVVWTTEFGRTPYHEKADHACREHHHQAFSSWLAGGGVKSGIAYGSSDDPLGQASPTTRQRVAAARPWCGKIPPAPSRHAACRPCCGNTVEETYPTDEHRPSECSFRRLVRRREASGVMNWPRSPS